MKPNQITITIPRSFAALSKAASTNKDAPAYLRTVLMQALPRGRVRGVALDGFGILRMESNVPKINLDLFGAAPESATAGTLAAVGADDLATVVRAVKAPKDGDPPPVEVLIASTRLGPEVTVRCGSEQRRVQVDGGAAGAKWPSADPGGLIPTGDVTCAQLVSASRLHALLAAIVAAGVETVKVEMRGGLAGLCFVGMGESGEDVTGMLMPIKSAGEALDDGSSFKDAVSEAARQSGVEAEVVES